MKYTIKARPFYLNKSENVYRDKEIGYWTYGSRAADKISRQQIGCAVEDLTPLGIEDFTITPVKD